MSLVPTGHDDARPIGTRTSIAIPIVHQSHRCIHDHTQVTDPAQSPTSQSAGRHRPNPACGAQIPIAPAAPPHLHHRGFVPWRLSDAGRRCCTRPWAAGIRNPSQSETIRPHSGGAAYPLQLRTRPNGTVRPTARCPQLRISLSPVTKDHFQKDAYTRSSEPFIIVYSDLSGTLQAQWSGDGRPAWSDLATSDKASTRSRPPSQRQLEDMVHSLLSPSLPGDRLLLPRRLICPAAIKTCVKRTATIGTHFKRTVPHPDLLKVPLYEIMVGLYLSKKTSRSIIRRIYCYYA